jgi:hypothetical protein
MCFTDTYKHKHCMWFASDFLTESKAKNINCKDMNRKKRNATLRRNNGICVYIQNMKEIKWTFQ